MGYHQLAVALTSQEKLAFQGPDAIKWTYRVMPFGPTNGPATLIQFIHDIDSQWKALAVKSGLVIDDNTNTKIIVNDIFSWAKSLEEALMYMECQLQICLAYPLSLSLLKRHIFPKCFDFVGIDVCLDGNRPTMSKHQPLEHWPQPEIVRDVAKIVGFAQFYSKFIPQFELQIVPLCDLTTKFEYTDPVTLLWTSVAQDSFEDIQQSVLLDSCLMHFNHQQLIVLCTNFSSRGFGYVVCQPGNDEASNAAMNAYQSGADFSFMTKSSMATLPPFVFGTRGCRGNKIRLHSHLGKRFSRDYAMNKCRHYLFSQQFNWVTDCYAIKFILSYNGANHAILCLQMRLMGWDVDIVHRNDHYITNADYWLCLGADLCFDPLFKTYLDLTRTLCIKNPPPTSFPMKPKNMSYYCGPQVVMRSNTDTCSDANHCQAIISTVIVDNCRSLCHLSNIPVRFGDLGRVTPSTSHSLDNDKFLCYALQVLQFSWVVYSFQGGHLVSTIQSRNLPFHVKMACDPFELGRSLFQEFTSCCQVFGTANDMLNHIWSSGDTSIIHGYMVHSPCFQTSDTTTKFWQVQAALISDLRLIPSLSIFVATIHPNHDSHSFKKFSTNLKSKGWIISSIDVHYPDLGDTVAGRCCIITAVHSSCASTVELLQLKRPPSVPPRPLGKFIWKPFNCKEHAILLACDNSNFTKQDTCLQASTPSIKSDEVAGVSVRYHLHCSNANASITLRSEVIFLDGLCPVFNACPNPNIFQHYFGIEFHHEDYSYVRAISPYKLVCTSTSNVCAMPALVVPLQTQPKASPPNWCTIFPSRCHSLSYSSTPTLLESTLALMVLRCIWLRAVV
jgi:hypothetical protein